MTAIYLVQAESDYDYSEPAAIYADPALAAECAVLLGLTIQEYEVDTGLPVRVIEHHGRGWCPPPAEAGKLPRGATDHRYEEYVRWHWPSRDWQPEPLISGLVTRVDRTGANYHASGFDKAAVVARMSELRRQARAALGYGVPL